MLLLQTNFPALDRKKSFFQIYIVTIKFTALLCLVPVSIPSTINLLPPGQKTMFVKRKLKIYTSFSCLGLSRFAEK